MNSMEYENIINLLDPKNNRKITRPTNCASTKDATLIALLNYSSKVWRTFKIPLTNCKTSLISQQIVVSEILLVKHYL